MPALLVTPPLCSLLSCLSTYVHTVDQFFQELTPTTVLQNIMIRSGFYV